MTDPWRPPPPPPPALDRCRPARLPAGEGQGGRWGAVEGGAPGGGSDQEPPPGASDREHTAPRRWGV